MYIFIESIININIEQNKINKISLNVTLLDELLNIYSIASLVFSFLNIEKVLVFIKLFSFFSNKYHHYYL